MYYNGISKTHWQERLRAELGDERFKEYMLIQSLLPPPEELHVPASVRIALERQEAICGRDDEARGSGDPAPKAIKEKAMPPAPKPAMLGNMALAPHLQISPKVIAVDPPPKKASVATPLAAPKAPVETLPKVPVSPLTPPEAPVEAPPKAPVEAPPKAPERLQWKHHQRLQWKHHQRLQWKHQLQWYQEQHQVQNPAQTEEAESAIEGHQAVHPNGQYLHIRRAGHWVHTWSQKNHYFKCLLLYIILKCTTLYTCGKSYIKTWSHSLRISRMLRCVLKHQSQRLGRYHKKDKKDEKRWVNN